MDELWSRYLQSRSVEDRNALVERYMPWADNIVRRMARKLPSHAAQDAASDAVVGLIQAVERYDPASGRAFEVFAKARVSGAVFDGLRSFSRFDSRTQTERTPSTFTSLGVNNGDVFGKEDDLVVDNIDEAKALLSRLKYKQRIVLIERCNGTSMSEIGAILGRDESTVCQIERAALRAIRRHVGSTARGSISGRKQTAK